MSKPLVFGTLTIVSLVRLLILRAPMREADLGVPTGLACGTAAAKAGLWALCMVPAQADA